MMMKRIFHLRRTREGRGRVQKTIVTLSFLMLIAFGPQHSVSCGEAEGKREGTENLQRIWEAIEAGKKGDHTTAPLLVEALRDERLTNFWVGCMKALERLGDSSGVPIMVEKLRSPRSLGIRLEAIEALGASADSRVTPALISALDDRASSVRARAADMLAERDAKEAIPRLRDHLRDEDSYARIHIAGALLRLGDDSGKEILVRACGDWSTAIRIDAAYLLASAGALEGLPVLIVELHDNKDQYFRAQAARRLSSLHVETTLDDLIAALKDTDRAVRIAAVMGLGVLLTEKAKKALEKMHGEEEDPHVRMYIANALRGNFRLEEKENRTAPREATSVGGEPLAILADRHRGADMERKIDALGSSVGNISKLGDLLQRYHSKEGRFPGRLEEIQGIAPREKLAEGNHCDPFNEGKPLRYRRVSKHECMLWSLGPDGDDDMAAKECPLGAMMFAREMNEAELKQFFNETLSSDGDIVLRLFPQKRWKQGTLLYVSGSLTREKGVKLDPWFLLKGVPDPPEPVPGWDFGIFTVDKYGNPVNWVGYPVGAVLDAGMLEFPFGVVMALPDEVVKVVFKYEGEILREVPRSMHPPTVTILGVEQGKLSWTASDPDSEKLYYLVSISKDGGKTWPGGSGTFIETTTYPIVDCILKHGDGEYIARVVASDRFNESQALSHVIVIEDGKVVDYESKQDPSRE